jgi:hypothetical protein
MKNWSVLFICILGFILVTVGAGASLYKVFLGDHMYMFMFLIFLFGIYLFVNEIVEVIRK